jgi:UDP-N-acetylglucosamine 1-carboxyvinyltransferase
VAAAVTGGDVVARGADPAHLAAVLDALESAGCDVERAPGAVRVARPGRLAAVGVETEPFPGFPTDVQAQWMALLCVAEGRATIKETIFENRFMHAAELARLGARIETAGNTAAVEGVASLRGASVMATDLRASASLVLAGLAATGRTEVLRLYHLDRGYERLEDKLAGLGARVSRVADDARAAPRLREVAG